MTREYDPRISTTGPEAAPAVVLVPGMDGTGQLFYRQVPLLSRMYRVATYALRDDAPAMETLIDDLARVIEVVAPDERRAIVVGESFGGTLALSTALARPDRVSRLVVLNSFPYFAPQLRLRLAIAGLRLMPWKAMTMVRWLTASRMHSRYTHRQELDRFMALTAGATRDGYVNRLHLLRRFDVRGRLGDITTPTLFIAAEQDHLIPSVAQARWMAARVPGATVRVLAGHGHICLIAPDVDLAAMLEEWRIATPGAITSPPPQ